MIFPLKILKNYIARCDFCSCRQNVDRLANFLYTPIPITVLHRRISDTVLKFGIFHADFHTLRNGINDKRITADSRTLTDNRFTAENSRTRIYRNVVTDSRMTFNAL